MRDSLSDLRVLVVDDNRTNRAILVKQLKSWGVHTVSVPGADAALETLEFQLDQGQGFDVALVDMQMPEVDGLELCRSVRANSEYAGLRLVMLTSLGISDHAVEAREIGVDAYLSKPVRERNLYNCLAGLVGAPILVDQDGRTSGGRSAASEPPLQGRVLVAEDNPVNQKLVARMLDKLGLEFTIAANGEEAVTQLQEGAFSAILMDCQMPVMDGFEATTIIRAMDGPISGIPIIALTANAMEGARERTIEAGMNDYIAKPFQLQKLAAALREWLPLGAECSGISSDQ